MGWLITVLVIVTLSRHLKMWIHAAKSISNTPASLRHYLNMIIKDVTGMWTAIKHHVIR